MLSLQAAAYISACQGLVQILPLVLVLVCLPWESCAASRIIGRFFSPRVLRCLAGGDVEAVQCWRHPVSPISVTFSWCESVTVHMDSFTSYAS